VVLCELVYICITNYIYIGDFRTSGLLCASYIRWSPSPPAHYPDTLYLGSRPSSPRCRRRRRDVCYNNNYLYDIIQGDSVVSYLGWSDLLANRLAESHHAYSNTVIYYNSIGSLPELPKKSWDRDVQFFSIRKKYNKRITPSVSAAVGLIEIHFCRLQYGT